jgi:hypothetical protein
LASKITAIRKYRPEIKRMPTMQMDELMEQMVLRTGLTKGEIYHVAYELCDALLSAHRDGRAVKVDGLGTFTPTIRANGKVDTVFRSEPALRRQLNNETRFYAKILNKASIGKSADELVVRWNEEHPEDVVE